MSVLAFLPVLGWGVFVGVVFSMIGAAGGILTAFGLISLFGVIDPNAVKPMTQLVVLAATITFIPSYFRSSSLVIPLGLLLGASGFVGAYAGSTISSYYLTDMETFRPLFGALTLAIAAQIFWKLYRAPPDAGNVISKVSPISSTSVDIALVSWRVVIFSCGTEEYRVPTWSPIVAGAMIAMTAGFFGVGGGFLLVPYMATLLVMPMHVIPATAAVAIFMSLVMSISNFVALGAPLEYDLLIPLTVGAVLGSLVGPRINKASKNTWLQYFMATIVAGIGLKYTFF